MNYLRSIGVLGSLLLAGCSPSVKKPGEQTVKGFTFTHENGVQWIESGNIEDALSLLHPADLPNGVSSGIPDCASFTPDVLRTTEDVLAATQSAFVRGEAPPTATLWITSTEHAYFKVNILTNQAESDARLGVSKIPATQIAAEAAQSDQSIDLAAARVSGSISVRTTARQCLERSLCNATGQKGGSYMSTLYYGASFRFGLRTASFQAKATGENDVVGVDVSFSLKKDNLSVAGEIRGTIADPTMTTTRLLELLSDTELFGIDNWLQQATRFDVVAYKTTTVPAERCSALQSQPVPAP